MHYSKETPSCSTFRVITTNVLGVRIFRKFTVTLSVFRQGFSLCKSSSVSNYGMSTAIAFWSPARTYCAIYIFFCLSISFLSISIPGLHCETSSGAAASKPSYLLPSFKECFQANWFFLLSLSSCMLFFLFDFFRKFNRLKFGLTDWRSFKDVLVINKVRLYTFLGACLWNISSDWLK